MRSASPYSRAHLAPPSSQWGGNSWQVGADSERGLPSRGGEQLWAWEDKGAGVYNGSVVTPAPSPEAAPEGWVYPQPLWEGSTSLIS